MIIVLLILYETEEHNDVSMTSIMSVNIIMDGKGNTKKGLAIAYEVIFFLTNILLMVFTCLFWIKQEKYKNKLDEDNQTDADYAVMIKNLPVGLKNSELKAVLAQNGIDEEGIIYINKCFKIDHIMKLKKEQFEWVHKKKYLEVFRRMRQEEGDPDFGSAYPPRSILDFPSCKKFPTEDQIVEKLEGIQKELLDENNQKVEYCGTSIVVFENEVDAETVANHYNVNKFKRYIKKFLAKRCRCLRSLHKESDDHKIRGKRIYAKRAPEPGDIIWENVPTKKRQRF